MKKTILSVALVLLPLLAFCQTNKDTYTIIGTVKNIPDLNKVFLRYEYCGDWVSDSAQVVDNKFKFTGKIAQPIFLLSITPRFKVKRKFDFTKDWANLFIEPGVTTYIDIDGYVRNSVVKGGSAQNDYSIIAKELDPLFDKQHALFNNSNEKLDSLQQVKLEVEFDKIDSLQKIEYKKFAVAHPASPISVWALQNYAGYDIKVDEIEPIFNSLSEKNRLTKQGKYLGENIRLAKVTGIGRTAPEIVLPDTLGHNVALSSLKGKYVLIDFWASWCGPCRAELPNVIKNYNQYKDKGFEVYGVSFDEKSTKSRWLKAIVDEKIKWVNVSDLKGFESEAGKTYGIRAIPQNFLLDPTGKIIAKNIMGEALSKKLSEVFK